MLGIDTNILLRLVLVDDADQHEIAKDYLLTHCNRDNPGHVSVVVLCEFVWTLERTFRFSKENQAKAVQALLDVEHFLVEDHDLVRLALEEFRSSKAEFPDCLIGRRNARAGCDRTVTFDKAASKLGSFELLS